MRNGFVYYPPVGGLYWMVDDCGKVVTRRWSYSPKNKERRRFGNVFETQEEAENYKAMCEHMLTNWERHLVG